MSKLNWSIWLRMPSLTANQAVALSLGTDPNNLAWNFQAANRDRLTLFKACHKTPIAPADLVKWAQSVEWNIPLELAALAPIEPVELAPLPTDAIIQALREIVAPGVTPEVLLSEVSKAGVKFISDNGESIAVIPDGTVMGRRVGFKYLRGSLPNSVGHLIRGSGASGGGAVQSAAAKPQQTAPVTQAATPNTAPIGISPMGLLMNEPLFWNTLPDAANWLAELTGETWTLRRVLDTAMRYPAQRGLIGASSNMETAIAAALPEGHALHAYILNMGMGRQEVEGMLHLSEEARKATAVPRHLVPLHPVRLLQNDVAQVLQAGWVELTLARDHARQEIYADGTPRYLVAIEPPATVRIENLGLRGPDLVALAGALPATPDATLRLAPVETELPSAGMEPANDEPTESGLLTKEIAVCFGGCYYTQANWPKRMSDTKWLHTARIGLGEAGGASGLWRPLMLAQLMHGKTKSKKEKEALMKILASRFSRLPALAPWKDAFNEYSSTFSDLD